MRVGGVGGVLPEFGVGWSSFRATCPSQEDVSQDKRESAKHLGLQGRERQALQEPRHRRPQGREGTGRGQGEGCRGSQVQTLEAGLI